MNKDKRSKDGKPNWQPFEVTHEGNDPAKTITTWRYENGATEQWHGDEWVYGPEGSEPKKEKKEKKETGSGGSKS